MDASEHLLGEDEMGAQRALTLRETLLLEWLSKEDSSAYGACMGRDLNELVARGLAVVGDLPEGVPNGYQRVSLTDAGIALATTSPAERPVLPRDDQAEPV